MKGAVQLVQYKGWHSLYANRCAWHQKSVEALLQVAMDFGIEIIVKEQKTVQEAKTVPAAFGVLNLLHDGKL